MIDTQLIFTNGQNSYLFRFLVINYVRRSMNLYGRVCVYSEHKLSTKGITLDSSIDVVELCWIIKNLDI